MTKSDRDLGRFFLVGCPRSGTTLVQSFLAAHPKMVTFPESHFFDHFLPDPARYWKNRLKRPFRVNVQLPGKVREFLEAMDMPERIDQFPPKFITRSRWAKAFVTLLDALAAEADATAWIEKTPDHAQFIPLIQRYVPHPRFIHLIREGRDTVASLYDVSQKYPDVWEGDWWTIEHCVELWNNAWRIAQSWKGHPDHFIVRFESFIDDPEHVLNDLCRFMNVPFDPVMLRRESTNSAIVGVEESWKSQALGQIYRPKSKFDILTPDQQAYVRANLDGQASNRVEE